MNVQQQSARLRPFRPVPFGRYTLLTPVSVGGMGEIFLARLEGAQGFEKLCVIKKILPSLAADPEFVERFVNEAKILVKLSHGSIAQVLDVGLFEGDPYIALEFVDGKDLRKIAARARDRSLPLPLTFVLYVMARVLDALAYAHRKRGEDDKEIGLVHRDVSPQNILVSYEGEVKVIDFGLAKSSLSSARTNPSMILGKFLYMSPEQARHQKVDRRSDLYSAGLCLYELVAGRNPFDDVPPHELMAKVANPVIPPIGTIDPLCPPVVQEMVARALELDPSKRFQTAEEFRGRVMAALLEIDPSAGPESVSRYMRDSFNADYQQERKLLSSLKAMARPADEPSPREEKKRGDHETAVFALRDVAPTQDAARALSDGPPPPSQPTPKTLPSQPIEPSPLSFAPTPRAREPEQPHPITDGETVPGVVVSEELRRASMPTGPELPAVLAPAPSRPWEETTDHLEAIPPDTVVFPNEAFASPPPEQTQPRAILSDADALASAYAPLREDTQPRVVLGTLLDDAPVLPSPHGRVRTPTRPANPLELPTAEHTPPNVDVSGLLEPTDAASELVTGETGVEETGVRPIPRRGRGARLLLWTLALCFGAALAVGGFWGYERYGKSWLAGLTPQPPKDPSALMPLPPMQPPPSPAPAAIAEEDAGPAVAEAAKTETDAGGAPEDADLLAPLTLERQPDPTAVMKASAPEAAPAPVKPAVEKRPRPRKPAQASPELRKLRAEWEDAQKLFRALKRRYSCDVPPMKITCFKVDELDAQMEDLDDERGAVAAARARVRSLRAEMRDLSRQGP